MIRQITSENIRGFFLLVLFISIPFSIAGDDFAVIGLYLVTFYRLARKEDRWIHTPVIYGMGFMFLGALISALLSDSVLLSLSYFRNFWRLGLPFLILLAFKDRSHDRHIKTLALVSSLIAIYSVIQYFTGLDVLRSAVRQAEFHSTSRVWYAVGVFSHHLTYGGVSLVLFGMFLPNGASRERNRGERIFFIMAATCNFAAVIVCMGRSIWLGAIAAAAVVVFTFLGRKRSLIAIVLVSLLAGGFLGYQSTLKRSFFKTSALGKRIGSISVKSNLDRLYMWEASLRVIRDHPVLGLGPNRRELMDPYYDRIKRMKRHKFQHPPTVGVHNIYLQNWIDFGLLGMLGYLVWWGTLLIQILFALRQGPITLKRNAQLAGILASLVGIMVAGVFENNFRDGEVQTAILVAMGLALVLLNPETSRRQEKKPTLDTFNG